MPWSFCIGNVFFNRLISILNCLLPFIPAAVVGLLLHHYIESLLKSVVTVAIAFIVGGVILIFIDRIFKNQIEDANTEDDDLEETKKLDEFGVERTLEVLRKFTVSWKQAFIIGCFQCLGMIPGVSRSAATIVGGLTQKLNIKRAAEFSFFLAVPTLFAASIFELKKNFSYIKGTDINDLLIGGAVSFVVGMLAIIFFIGLITRYGLKFFGYYRILFGVFILILYALGHAPSFKPGVEGP